MLFQRAIIQPINLRVDHVMASHAFLPLMSATDYLAGELESQIRHEYIAGYAYAMSGASERHNFISGNLYSALRQFFRGGAAARRRFAGGQKRYAGRWK